MTMHRDRTKPTLPLGSLIGLAVAGTVAVAGSALAQAEPADTAERVFESKQVIMSFAGELQGALKAAVQEGGPVNGIRVCNEVAPGIAAKHATARGWEVGRTSLKVRNSENAPDAWEQQILQQFIEERAAGADPATLEVAEVMEEDGQQVFRFMKAIAIPEGAPCLACHGTDIKPEVAAALAELYPEDAATGYSTGDIRGAFTIKQPM